MTQWTAHKTPGYEGPKGWYVENENSDPITGWGSVTTTQAHTTLIAAAPEMLKALKTGEDPDGYAQNGPELLELAAEYLSARGAWMGVADALRAKALVERAALAKARGE